MVTAAELHGFAGFLLWLIAAIVVGGIGLAVLAAVVGGIWEFLGDAWPLVLGVLVVGGIVGGLVYFGVQW